MSYLISEYVRLGASALLYVLAIFGWGSLAARISFRSSTEGFADFFLSRIVAGCAVLYAAFIGLGAAHALHRGPVAITLGIGVLGCFAAFDDILRRIKAGFDSVTSWSSVERVLCATVGILVLLQLACGLTPLIFYDLQVYQLVGPSQFLQHGSFIEIPWNILSNSPLALQLTLGMSLVLDADGGVAKLLLAVFGCGLALATSQLIANRKGALLAAIFVLCFPEFWLNQTLGVVDLAVAAFLILGAVWGRRALTGGWKWTVLAGCAFGFVLGSRYQGVVLTAWILFALLMENVIRRRKIDLLVITRIAFMAVIAALFVAPWLVRNAVHFGNPVYPLMRSLFGSPGWSPSQAARLSSEVLGPSLKALPWTQWGTGLIAALTMMPSNGLFGLAMLFGAILALFVSRDDDVKLTAVLGIGGLLLWGVVHPTPGVNLLRFNAASLALLLAATAGVLTDEMFQKQRGLFAGLTLACGSFLMAVPFVQSIVPVFQTLVDPAARAQVWEANVPSWQAFDFVNANLAMEQKVLLIGETRGFWLHVPFLAATPFDAPHLAEVFSGSDENAWRQRLKELGITHILLSWPEWDRLRNNYEYLRLPPDGISLLNAWFRAQPLIFDDSRGTVVLSLEASR